MTRTERKKKLLHRCSRIEGQLRGIHRMIDEEVYCDDILNQIAAAQSALSSLAKEIFNNHLRTCLTARIRSDDETVYDEVKKTLEKLL